ncbi:MAG: GNAT family N-acetyltransferase [Pseudomonadota bacterium]
MRVRRLKARQADDSVWAAFHGLRDASRAYDNPFFDPDLARILSEAREDVELIIAEADDGIGAIWPVHVRPGGWVRPLTGPFSDWHGPVVGDGCELTARDLLEQAGLAGLTTGGLRLQDGVVPDGLSTETVYVCDLSCGFETYDSAQRSSHAKHFKRLRRKRRQLEEEQGVSQFVLDNRDPEVMRQVIAMKRQQYQSTGRHDVLEPVWAQKMVDALWAGDFQRLGVRLSTLCIADRLVAAELNLVSKPVLHGWLVVYDRDFARYSPGMLVMMDILQAMTADGFTRYDLGAGDGHYKKYHANAHAEIGVGILRSRAGGVRPSRWLAEGWRALEAQSPERISEVMGKIRRRSDQILAAEPELPRRVRGFFGAARAPLG